MSLVRFHFPRSHNFSRENMALTTAGKATALTFLVLISNAFVFSTKVPTLYDVLQLVYQVCATEGESRFRNLECVSYHMGTEVADSMHRCMTESNNQSAIDHFCEQLTHVEAWTAKHSSPPEKLTTVMGLAALGRMACVLGDVHRPLPMWQAAFSKCFPDYRHGPINIKGNSKSRSENTLGRERA